MIPMQVAQAKSHCGRGGNRGWCFDHDVTLARPRLSYRALRRLRRFLLGGYGFPVVVEYARRFFTGMSAMLTIEAP
jgi:hypothetical protein